MSQDDQPYDRGNKAYRDQGADQGNDDQKQGITQYGVIADVPFNNEQKYEAEQEFPCRLQNILILHDIVLYFSSDFV
jgi:hypothetical protein